MSDQSSADLIDQSSLPRIAADQALADEAGLVFTEGTLFEHGTVLYDSGKAEARRSRQAFDDKLPLAEVHALAGESYVAQKRIDVSMDLRRLEMMSDTGLIMRADRQHMDGFVDADKAGVWDDRKDRSSISPLALGQVVARLGGPTSSSSYLMNCPTDLRAHNFNAWGDAAGSKPKSGLVRTMLDGRGHRSTYAVLSPQYKVRDLPQVLDVFVPEVEKLGAVGSKGEYKLQGAGWAFYAHFHSTIKADDLVVGDIFRGVAWVSGVDDGTGCVRVGVSIERARCRNLTTISAEEVVGLRHNSVDFDRRIREAVATQVGRISGFATKWAKAAHDDIVDGIHGGGDPQYIFGELVRRGLVKIPGYERAELVQKLVRAWEAEPGYTRADVVNAVSRAAHTETWKSPWYQEQLEEQAGKILYNYVVLTPPPA